MKTILVTMTILHGLTALAQTPAHSYECIARKLQSYDSDIFINLSPADIEELLAATGAGTYAEVLGAAVWCDNQSDQ